MSWQIAPHVPVQDTLPQEGRAEQLLSLKGQDLIGVPLQACAGPLSYVCLCQSSPAAVLPT